MATKRGTTGSDTLRGTTGADDLYGLGGNDGLYGLEGNDRLWGGSGVDALFGAAGNDQMYGEAGDDYMLGGLGADYLHGGSGNDRLRGEDGADVLNGGPGDNDLRGGIGNDTIIHYGRAADGNPGGKAFYDGGSGTDTLALDVIGPFRVTEEDLAGVVGAYVSSDGTGLLEYLTEPFNPFTASVGTFAGFETFRLQENSNMQLDFSANKTATVFGGKNSD
jgi:Ca2+-binding RTX toxin-like protein